MKLTDHVVYVLVVVLVAVLGIIVLTALGDPIPDTLRDVVLALTGAGAGLAVPRQSR